VERQPPDPITAPPAAGLIERDADGVAGTPSPVKAVRKVPITTLVLLMLATYGQNITWNFYDAQVPIELSKYLSSAALIGLAMGIDNILGIFVQPWMGAVSDRRRARTGNRLVYIGIGAPIAAVPFAFIPHAGNLWVLLACIVAFALVANAFKPLIDVLLADYVSPPKRIRANGFLKLVLGITVASSSLISILLVDSDLGLAFLLPAVLMVATLWIAVIPLRRHESWERQTGAPVTRAEPKPPISVRAVYRDLVSRAGRIRLLLILGVLGFNAVWQGQRSLFSVYGVEELGLARGLAGGLNVVGAVLFFVACIPVARVSDRFGRIRMIRFGAVLFIVGMLINSFLPYLIPTMLGIGISTVGFAFFAINGLPAFWDIAPSPSEVGAYTGVYGVAYAIGAALGPAVVGGLIDLTAWRYMMPHLALLGALVLVALIYVERRQRRESVAPEPTP
jgi:MFS family permease